MKVMLDYIHRNYTQPISVEDLACAAAISQSECFRCFCGTFPGHSGGYINQFRLLQASQLLSATDRSMADICFSTGFNNTSYFSKKIQGAVRNDARGIQKKRKNEHKKIRTLPSQRQVLDFIMGCICLISLKFLSKNEKRRISPLFLIPASPLFIFQYPFFRFLRFTSFSSIARSSPKNRYTSSNAQFCRSAIAAASFFSSSE